MDLETFSADEYGLEEDFYAASPRRKMDKPTRQVVSFLLYVRPTFRQLK